MDLLSDVLMRLKLKGTLYFRTSLTSPWGVEVPQYENVMRFHYAHKGRCLVRVDKVAEPVALEQGDLLIIPRGASHRLFCDPRNEHHVLPLETVLRDSGFTGEGVLIYGGDEDLRDTQLICGHFAFDPLMRHALLDNVPPFIRIENYGEAAGLWMEQTLRMIGTETGRAQLGGNLIALKMSEIIFAQALRAFIEREGAAHKGLAGFADPRVARALTAFHKAPGEDWSVVRLAEEAGMSRTAFATGFAELMGVTPMGYVTDWRMQIARHALAQGDDSVGAVGEQVGYASEAAFMRVFKRASGLTPSAFRRRMRAA